MTQESRVHLGCNSARTEVVIQCEHMHHRSTPDEALIISASTLDAINAITRPQQIAIEFTLASGENHTLIFDRENARELATTIATIADTILQEAEIPF